MFNPKLQDYLKDNDLTLFQVIWAFYWRVLLVHLAFSAVLALLFFGFGIAVGGGTLF